MRFAEFKILKEDQGGTVYVIGDSIANGIATAGGVSTSLTDPGKNTSFILQNLITPFVRSGKAKGSTVILSSGAANSANIRTEDGEKIQSENLGPVNQQIKILVDAGAKVSLVGVGSGKTPPQKPTQYTKGKKWIVDYTGMNDQLSSIASANGAKFLGPLEDFDHNIMRGDGIHPFNGYGKLFRAGSVGAKGSAGKSQEIDTDSEKIEVSYTYDPDVERDQKILLSMGYSVGSAGADGKLGPDTARAIKQFNRDYDAGKLDKAKVKAAHAKYADPKSTKPASTGKIIVPAKGRISQPFGQVSSRGTHRGVDIAVPVGTPIQAPIDGTVIVAGPNGNAGLAVNIKAGDQEHKLFHLSKVNVSVGDKVSQGDVVALSGNTGLSTGPHLHWEKHISGTATDPLTTG